MYGAKEHSTLCNSILCVLELLHPNMVSVIRTTARYQFVCWDKQKEGEITIGLHRTALIPTRYTKHKQLFSDGFMISASCRRVSRRLRKLPPLLCGI